MHTDSDVFGLISYHPIKCACCKHLQFDYQPFQDLRPHMCNKMKTIGQINKLAEQETERVKLAAQGTVVHVHEDGQHELQTGGATSVLLGGATPVKKRQSKGTPQLGENILNASPGHGASPSAAAGYHGGTSAANSIDFAYIQWGHSQKTQLAGVTQL